MTYPTFQDMYLNAPVEQGYKTPEQQPIQANPNPWASIQQTGYKMDPWAEEISQQPVMPSPWIGQT